MQIIKQLRKSKAVNQSDLAAAIGVSLRTVQLYEKKDANIPIKNLTKIAEYFGLTIGELYMQEVNEEESTYAKTKVFSAFGNVCYPLANGKYLVMAPVLFEGLQQQYLKEYPNQELKESLVKAGFIVDYFDEGGYMAFEIIGNAMNNGSIESIPNGTIVLGKMVAINDSPFSEISDALLNKPVIVVFESRIICKRLTGYNTDKEMMVFDNLNDSPEYQGFEMPFSEALEVYEVIKKQL
ncbi:helix-turn-helix transcriptional regulator [uncultured Croceitalea sp.]|uniref:helix-turn-helix domain-containing protein n=1 Tax=uncultured Croceitalea sp. TaxID=1798908 RepID=UPI0033067362